VLVSTSSTAYVNDEIALGWIKHFDKYSIRCQTGEYRILLFDGHVSHKTHEFLSYCVDHKIIPFFLRPHTSHICQPLDVSVFQPYKHFLGEVIGTLCRNGIPNITKVDFIDKLEQIRASTFKAGTFANSGLYPYNPSVVIGRLREKTPPMISPPRVWNTTTPTNRKSITAMIQEATEGCVSPTLGIQKLGMAALASFNRIELLEQQVAQMTAAKRHKDEINRSKRRINQISGQTGSFYVSTASKTVKEREDKEAAKKASSEELKRKREANNTQVKETEENTTQTLSNGAHNLQDESVLIDYSVPDFMT
jgi:hypothetical protein